MARFMNGDELLARLDRDIALFRRRRRDAETEAAEVQQDHASLQREMVGKYTSLSEVRLDLIASQSNREGLDRLHRKAGELIDRHADYITDMSSKADVISDELGRLEQERQALSGAHKAATDQFDAKVLEIEAGFTQDDGYQELVRAYDEAAAIVSRASKKRDLAQENREKKGQPYEADPLFSYLWQRNYRSPAYRASPFTRMLDGWVAKLCRYDEHFLNYQRLTELPERLGEHVSHVTGQAEAALAALETAEHTALQEGGATVLQEEVQSCVLAIEQKDIAIAEAEARFHKLVSAKEALATGASGPAAEARALIEQGLGELQLPSLRILAAETRTLDDDHLVDDLVRLKAEERAVQRQSGAASKRVAVLDRDLSALEAVRRKIKSDRLGSPYVRYRTSSVENILHGLETGQVGATGAIRRLQKSVKRAGPVHQSGFGGRRRTRTMGVPDILGDVMWEVGREVLRQSRNSGGWSGGSPRRSRRRTVRRPRSSSRGGGFRTGGGF